MKTTIIATLVVAVGTSLSFSPGEQATTTPKLPLQPVCLIAPQPEAPLALSKYVARYQEGGRYSTKGVNHSVAYKNNTNRKVVALQVGLVSFSVWNEFLDRTGGVDMTEMSPGATGKGSWVTRSLADFTFLTGFAYVSKVRFANGEIWSADLPKITAELRKIEKGFDDKNLKDKK